MDITKLHSKTTEINTFTFTIHLYCLKQIPAFAFLGWNQQWSSWPVRGLYHKTRWYIKGWSSYVKQAGENSCTMQLRHVTCLLRTTEVHDWPMIFHHWLVGHHTSSSNELNLMKAVDLTSLSMCFQQSEVTHSLYRKKYTAKIILIYIIILFLCYIMMVPVYSAVILRKLKPFYVLEA